VTVVIDDIYKPPLMSLRMTKPSQLAPFAVRFSFSEVSRILLHNHWRMLRRRCRLEWGHGQRHRIEHSSTSLGNHWVALAAQRLYREKRKGKYTSRNNACCAKAPSPVIHLSQIGSRHHQIIPFCIPFHPSIGCLCTSILPPFFWHFLIMGLS
jgi:hypothetical protein